MANASPLGLVDAMDLRDRHQRKPIAQRVQLDLLGIQFCLGNAGTKCLRSFLHAWSEAGRILQGPTQSPQGQDHFGAPPGDLRFGGGDFA